LLKEIAITIDVETDWGGRLEAKEENCVGIKHGLPIILNILNKYNVKATFFISAEIAILFRDTILEIIEHGHEIASHGYRHIDYSELSKQELYTQISKSKHIIEEQIGTQVLGFRAPQFRINQQMFDILGELEFKYDSSMVRGVFPGRYSGMHVALMPFAKGQILEIPITTIPYIRLPVGLLWINAMSVEMFKILSRILKFPHLVVLYLHPFDLLESKPSGGNFRWIVGDWYTWRKTKVQQTFEMLIKYWKECLFQFVQMNNIVNEIKAV